VFEQCIPWTLLLGGFIIPIPNGTFNNEYFLRLKMILITGNHWNRKKAIGYINI
jgi:hypothetical protein